MFPIIYLEEKILIRNAVAACIEQQEDCKVVYQTGSIEAMETYINNTKERIALCILSDNYGHQSLLKLIQVIRKYQPEIVLANAISDRHPDHGKGSSLATNACFMSGLSKIETFNEGVKQAAWRPKFVYHYIQNNYIAPDFIVDISEFWDKKVASIAAFGSQFYNPESQEPASFISSPEFLPFIESRARELGHRIQVKYGEGFTVERFIGVSDLFDLK